MSARTYPYTAWVLLPSFKPKAVVLVSRYGSSSWDVDVAESGKLYEFVDLHANKRAAVLEGWRRVDEQKDKLNKALASLERKRASLRIALAELGSTS